MSASRSKKRKGRERAGNKISITVTFRARYFNRYANVRVPSVLIAAPSITVSLVARCAASRRGFSCEIEECTQQRSFYWFHRYRMIEYKTDFAALVVALPCLPHTCSAPRAIGARPVLLTSPNVWKNPTPHFFLPLSQTQMLERLASSPPHIQSMRCCWCRIQRTIERLWWRH